MHQRPARDAEGTAIIVACVVVGASAAKAAIVVVNSPADDASPDDVATEGSTDDLLPSPALLGLNGVAATNGAIGVSATRPDWTAIRSYFDANRRTGFAR